MECDDLRSPGVEGSTSWAVRYGVRYRRGREWLRKRGTLIAARDLGLAEVLLDLDGFRVPHVGTDRARGDHHRGDDRTSRAVERSAARAGHRHRTTGSALRSAVLPAW
jgi:hypothetical protein